MYEPKNAAGQTWFHFGGTGIPLHLAIANGFPPQTYQAMLQPLLSECEAFAWLPRALWQPAPALSSAPHWKVMADDIRVGLQQQGVSGVIGVGHSMGGVATMLASVASPALFRALVFLDPVFLPPWMLWMMGSLRFLGVRSTVPLSRLARKRRKTFASREEALHYWRARRLFANWPDHVLSSYVDGLLVPDAVTGGVTLSWEPEWEAHYYETIYVPMWRYIRKLNPEIPVLLVRGSETDTLLPQAVKRLQKLLPHADVTQVEGHGHLFPQSAPEQTAHLVQTWLHEKKLLTPSRT